MPVGTDVGLGPSDIVLDADPAPPTQRGTAALPNFTAHVYGQMVGSIRMPLGTEVGLRPSDIVLDADPALPIQRGTAALLNFFRPICD